MSENDITRARLAQALIRPARAGEIVFVLGVPIGLSLASAIAWHVRRPGATPFTDQNLLLSLGIQVLFGIGMLWFLSRRGWRPIDVAGAPEVHDLGRGFALWLGLLAVFYFELLALFVVAPGIVAPLRTMRLTGTLSPGVAVAGAIIDPIFEEFFFLGYAVPALGNRLGIKAAFAISVLLRVAAHAYQGRLAIIAILPVALLLTFYFVRTGRLWPVIVAHIIQDSIALSLLGST